MIDGFINAIYVYDDRITFTYNYKDGTETITLSELESAKSSDIKCVGAPQKRHRLLSVPFLLCVTSRLESVAACGKLFGHAVPCPTKGPPGRVRRPKIPIPFSLFSVFFLSAEQIARLRRLINRAYDTAFLSIYRHTDRSRREQRQANPALGGQLFFEHDEGKQHRNQDAQPVNRHDDADLPLLNRVIIAQPRQSSRSRCSVCRNIRL